MEERKSEYRLLLWLDCVLIYSECIHSMEVKMVMVIHIMVILMEEEHMDIHIMLICKVRGILYLLINLLYRSIPSCSG